MSSQFGNAIINFTMKIIHISDTHLGFSAYRKLSENGYNQREEDIMLSFALAIDQIIEISPDLVLHCGDLFDVVRPTNRILRFAIEQILRLSAHKIPLVLISGNHETPKQRYIGSAFSIIDILPDPEKLRHVIYQNEYAKIQIKDVVIHAVPQCTTDEIFKEQLKKVKPAAQAINIAMLHAGVAGMEEFSHIESNELLVEQNWLAKTSLDYIALGHFHGHSKVSPNAWYCGSTDRMSFNEAGKAKGFIQLEVGSAVKPSFIEVKTRPMVELDDIDAANKDSVLLLEEILVSINRAEPAGKIIRLTIKNLPAHVLSALDTKKIREAAMPAVHFEARYEKVDEQGKVESIKLASGGIREEFKSFLSQANIKQAERERFYRLWQDKYNEVASEDD